MVRRLEERKEYRYWVKIGRPIPAPPLVKAKVVKEYGKRFGLRVFVETGTYYGEMICAVHKLFAKIYSIELSQDLFEAAKRRFASEAHITILQGDSADILAEVLKVVDEPCLFWLDAHYSGATTAKSASRNTPIRAEIAHILKHGVNGHVILVDDARFFTGKDDYPSLTELKIMLSRYKVFEVTDDIIRVF